MDDRTRQRLKNLEAVERHLDERCANLSYPEQKLLTEFIRGEINALCAFAEGQREPPPRLQPGSNPDVSH